MVKDKHYVLKWTTTTITIANVYAKNKRDAIHKAFANEKSDKNIKIKHRNIKLIVTEDIKGD